MKVLLAPDKFKGTLSAMQVCEAIEEVFIQNFPQAVIQKVPMADGGDGTADRLTMLTNGKRITVSVNDPLFRSIQATYGIAADGQTAFIEMASASGLILLQDYERNPLETTTIGTGQLIVDALARGVTSIVLGIGGSATSDAGMGMAEALGARFYTEAGELLKPIGKNLSSIHFIDISQLHPALKNVSFTVLCDVTNPLFGGQGAAHVFAPQKGATTDMVKTLDEGLQHFASVVKNQLHQDINFAGAGAGGGMAAGAKTFLPATFQSGIEFIMEYLGVEELVNDCDIVITGEGKVDEQTLSGKVVKGISALAIKHHKPLYIVAGKNELPEDQLRELGVKSVITLVDENTIESTAFINTYALLQQRVQEQIIPILNGHK